MKTYKLNGLEIYVVDAPSIEMAVMIVYLKIG